MRKDKVITLIEVDYTENAIGDNIEIENKRSIFASKKSIKQSEFYQAQAVGLRPELTFVVWSIEYKDETNIEYNGRKYSIIRTFEINDKETELVCSGVVNRSDLSGTS